MNLLLYVLAGACLTWRVERAGGAAQYFRDPSVTFQNITFDSTLRGSYNISQCVRDHMNCWEVIKADQVCDEWRDYHQDSVCSMLRTFCDDASGFQEFNNRFIMMESWCEFFKPYT